MRHTIRSLPTLPLVNNLSGKRLPPKVVRLFVGELTRAEEKAGFASDVSSPAPRWHHQSSLNGGRLVGYQLVPVWRSLVQNFGLPLQIC